MTLDDIVNALSAQKLQLDCVEMQLTQKTSANPISYRGRGYIRQTEDDRLTFKLFAAETRNVEAYQYLMAVMSEPSGRIYADTDYYELSVTDIGGRTWSADRILPNCQWLVSNPNPIVVGSFDRCIEKTEEKSARHTLLLYFFDDEQLPYTHTSRMEKDGLVTLVSDKAEFSVADCAFTVTKQERGFKVDVRCEHPLDAHLHTRIQEALRFLLARGVTWRIHCRQSGSEQVFEIAAGRPAVKQANLVPPISPTNVIALQYGWSLFSKYLEYVLGTPHPYWNVCSYHLNNAREASGGSIDSWAIGISVAVEALASLLKLDENEDEKGELKKLRNSVVEHVSTIPEFAGLIGRLSGLLNMMADKRPQDRLSSLVPIGHVDGKHIRAWQTMRNRHVHPKEVDIKIASGRNEGEMQRVLDLLYQITVLMYQVTFHLIGYEGKYTDYSIHNWPAADYPLSSPPDQL